ncbi:MAG TPA: hypothetical protein VFI47_15830 [Acidimicrobiales bacterium]|nr:hypothetical protein [Acidimicrobiales bacterium]
MTASTPGPAAGRGPQPGEGAGGGAGTTGIRDIARYLAALAMLGAAVIHIGFAPDHMNQQTSHGVFFLVLGWAQLLGAAVLGFGWRPQRTWLLGTAVLNLAVVALWLLTRTAGLPGDDPEAVGFPDALASGLEVFAAVAALAVAFGWLAGRAVRRPGLLLAGAPLVALVAVVSASITPSIGGGHGHGEGGHTDGGHDMGAMPGMDHGHDGGGGADAADWNATRIAALTGYLPDAEVARLREGNEEYLSEQIRQRSETLAGLPEAEREERIATFVDWSVAHALEGEDEAARAEGATMHSHGPDVWQEITDPAQARQLQAELQTAGTVIPKMRTAADAVAAGYFQVTPYVPGIGAHYLNPGLLVRDGFNPAEPEMLLYNGNEPTSELVGLSYSVLGDEAPEGFTGPNDSWHVHPSLCIVDNLVVGPDTTPEAMCDSIGGHKGMPFPKPMWMGHLWQVPGWDSPWGLFSGENPRVNFATSEQGRS